MLILAHKYNKIRKKQQQRNNNRWPLTEQNLSEISKKRLETNPQDNTIKACKAMFKYNK